jgi:hypothetical protein
LTVVRLLSVSPGVAGGTTPVTVTYQPIGILTEQGNISELDDAKPTTMKFDVLRLAENSSQLRIDRISGARPDGLLLSDETLDATYYRAHPIYFWDSTGRWLVPDVRYLPLTTELEQRRNQVLQWLIDGPADWLRPYVATLPEDTVSLEGVVDREGKLVVNLSAPAGTGGDEAALRKLVYQLRWSLSLRPSAPPEFPEIELQIEGQTREVASTSVVEDFDAAAGLGAAQRFAIDDGKVVLRPASSASPAPVPILDVDVNDGVIAAAVSRDLDLAAFVRPNPSGGMSLYVARRSGASPPQIRLVALRNAEAIGRPIIVPGTGQLLVVTDGRLYVINDKNKPTPITPPDLVGEITAVAIPPDARRIAFVADNKAYVAALDHSDGAISIGARRRPILANQVPDAVAVAWTSETSVLVAGLNGTRPSLWKVTADGVAADDRSDAFATGSGGPPAGLRPIDLVAHPESPLAPGQGEITVVTNQGAGRLFTTLVGEPRLSDPFYSG